jgi:hypothetical protein
MPTTRQKEATMSDKLTTKQAIEKVLRGGRKPMRVPAIIEAAVPLTALAGKTPGQTIYSVLYAENRRRITFTTRAIVPAQQDGPQ